MSFFNATSASVSEKSAGLLSPLIIIVVGTVVLFLVLLVAVIILWWYCGSFTQKDTSVRSSVPVQEKVHPKKDHFEERYIVQRTNSYQKTIYFANVNGQTKDNSFQKSRASPKLFNLKLIQHKSKPVFKLKYVGRDPSVTCDLKTKKLHDINSKIKQTGKSANESPLKSNFL